MTDENIIFLNDFIKLYESILSHDGYGDIHIHIKKMPGRGKEVRMLSGKEYRYLIPSPNKANNKIKYQIIQKGKARGHYNGPERRRGKDRRACAQNRRKKNEPRHFRLERRVSTDRRTGKGRRKDD